MIFSRETLQAFAPRPAGQSERAKNWDAYIEALITHGEELCASVGIDEASELQQFMAQIGHECDGFQIFREDMRYSAGRIMEIFGEGKHSAAITPSEANQLAGKPEALADRVYGIGNPKKAKEFGHTKPGDGYRYRGLGPMQVTGKKDHIKYLNGEETHLAGLRAAFLEWDAKDLNGLARAGDIKAITKKINGGYNGLKDRQAWLRKAQRVWPKFPGVDAPHVTTASIVAVSDKASLAQAVVTAAKVTAATATVAQVADPIAKATEQVTMLNTFTAALATLAGFVKANALLGVILLCCIGWYFGKTFIHKIIEDFRSGRYIPSKGDPEQGATS